MFLNETYIFYNFSISLTVSSIAHNHFPITTESKIDDRERKISLSR